MIARAQNRRERDRDPTAHAEMLALREAARHLGGWRLPECTLYVTLEPCAMCAGAIVQARIPRLVFGAGDPKAGAVGSITHAVEVTGGICEAECSDLLRQFFATLREPKNL